MSLLDFELLDVPIEFKQINPDDFDSQYYEVNPKHIITPNEEGYISSQIIDLIEESYDEKNTVVINAGVGQGKSYAVIE
jgi:3-dehydroquinate dehydratase